MRFGKSRKEIALAKGQSLAGSQRSNMLVAMSDAASMLGLDEEEEQRDNLGMGVRL